MISYSGTYSSSDGSSPWSSFISADWTSVAFKINAALFVSHAFPWHISPDSICCVTPRHLTTRTTFVGVTTCLFQHGGRQRSSSARVYKFSLLCSGFASVSGITSGKSKVDTSARESRGSFHRLWRWVLSAGGNRKSVTMSRCKCNNQGTRAVEPLTAAPENRTKHAGALYTMTRKTN